MVPVLGPFSGYGKILVTDLFRAPQSQEYVVVEAGEQSEPIPEEKDTPLSRLNYRNVLLFIIESYGYTAYVKEEHFKILKPFYETIQNKLLAAGFSSFSHFLSSPVIGGYSWLADASLLTGSRIDSQEKYEELLSSERRSLISFFNEAGYTTVLTAPGTLKPWPEGEQFYDFDHYYYARHFDYSGPQFSFVPIPDQFAIYAIHKKLLNRSQEMPLFIEYILVSSHAPFNRIPTFVEPWEDLGDGSIYSTTDILTFDNNWFGGKEYTEGYTAAIMYVLKVLSEYTISFIADESLIIIVGDHQPKYPVTERGQPLSVPIHILCRDKTLIEPFQRFGYSQGLIPNQPPPHPGIENFFNSFLELYGAL